MQALAGSDSGHYPRAHHAPKLNTPPSILPHPMSALSQLSSRIGSFTYASPSSVGSQSATPSPSNSTQEEEADYHAKVQEGRWTVFLFEVTVALYGRGIGFSGGRMYRLMC